VNEHNKYDRPCHPHTHTEREIPAEPARLCTEQEASSWFTPGSVPWYYAQGLEPAAQDTKETGENG